MNADAVESLVAAAARKYLEQRGWPFVGFVGDVAAVDIADDAADSAG